MLFKLRIPTTERFAYVQAEFEGTAEEALLYYRELTDSFREQTGLERNEWNAVVDKMLLESECNPDDIAIMNVQQQWFINETKKAFKRIKSRE